MDRRLRADREVGKMARQEMVAVHLGGHHGGEKG